METPKLTVEAQVAGLALVLDALIPVIGGLNALLSEREPELLDHEPLLQRCAETVDRVLAAIPPELKRTLPDH